MELGTQDVPARIQWRGRRMRAYQLVAWSYANEIPCQSESYATYVITEPA